ncbi:MAG: endonuclease domain-containing protein [Thermoleophilia bacterium]
MARTLFDLSEVVAFAQLRRSCEEADRLGLLETGSLRKVIERGWGRHALRPAKRIVDDDRAPYVARSPLEERFLRFCDAHRLPPPVTNVSVLDLEIDVLWPQQRVAVELDGFAFHHHRGAFERDRARDVALQVAGYRVIRITHRRLDQDAASVASQIRQLLGIRA